MLEAKDASNAELTDTTEDEHAALHDAEVSFGLGVAVCEGLGTGVGVGVEAGLDVFVVEEDTTDTLELAVDDFRMVLVIFDLKVAGRVNGN